VCPLAGRLQDQGHDAIALFEQCVDVIDRYGYDTKVMFSSVRHAEHVRQALLAGVHVCTMPFNVMNHLCDNVLTTVGTAQFREHTQLMTLRVGDVMRAENPVCQAGETLTAAMVKMTESRLGAVTLIAEDGRVAGVFTDGDLRRRLQEHGREILDETLAEIGFSKNPVTVARTALLNDAVRLFKEAQVDTLIVVDGDKPSGVLDIQDIVKLGFLGQR